MNRLYRKFYRCLHYLPIYIQSKAEELFLISSDFRYKFELLFDHCNNMRVAIQLILSLVYDYKEKFKHALVKITKQDLLEVFS